MHINPAVKKHFFWPALGLLTTVGFFIRLRIGYGVSFWADEGQYIEIVNLKSLSQFINYYFTHTSNDQPVLTYIAVYFWKSIVGITPERLRLLPTIISTASILGTGFFCYRFSKSRSVSLMMATIAALSPYMIRYSYDVSSYCFAGLFAPISFFLFLTSIRDQKYFWSWGALLTNVLLLNTHYFSYFLIFSQGLIFSFLILSQEQRRQFLKLFSEAMLLSICALLPFSFFFSTQTALAMQSWISRRNMGLWNIVSQTITLDRSTRITIFVFFIILVVRFISLFEMYDRANKRILSSSIACFFFTILVAWWVQLFTWKFIGHPRYFIVIFPILFFFMLYCFQGEHAWKTRTCIVLFLVIAFIYDIYKFQPYQVQDFRSAATYIESRNNKQTLMFSIPFANVFRYYFYVDHQDINFSSDNYLVGVLNASQMISLVENLRKTNVKKIIFAHTFVSDRNGLVNYLVNKQLPEYFLESTPVRHFKDIDIYEFELR